MFSQTRSKLEEYMPVKLQEGAQFRCAVASDEELLAGFGENLYGKTVVSLKIKYKSPYTRVRVILFSFSLPQFSQLLAQAEKVFSPAPGQEGLWGRRIMVTKHSQGKFPAWKFQIEEE